LEVRGERPEVVGERLEVIGNADVVRGVRLEVWEERDWNKVEVKGGGESCGS
jgi:hypothetical protein